MLTLGHSRKNEDSEQKCYELLKIKKKKGVRVAQMSEKEQCFDKFVKSIAQESTTQN